MGQNESDILELYVHSMRENLLEEFDHIEFLLVRGWSRRPHIRFESISICESVSIYLIMFLKAYFLKKKQCLNFPAICLY